MIKVSRTLFAGFVGGAVAVLAVGILVRALGAPSRRETLAEVDGKTLSREELRKTVAPDLIPIESDEYRVLERGVDEWLTNRLFEREAKVQGVTLEELYRKEIWSRVQISYGDISEYYNKTRELYNNQPFEKISVQISQDLRRLKYAGVKEEYLKELRKKYNAKVYLKKPASYVEGLALPSALPLPGGLPLGAAGPPAGPSVPSGPVAAKSEAGSPPSRGPETAPVTITEFADFHCGFCKKVAPTLQRILENYPGKVRLIFRHYPLSQTPGAGSYLTHEASTCAQEQGKFWEFYDSVFGFQGVPQETDLQTLAKNMGLDMAKFQECVKSGKYRNFLQQEQSEGNRRGVQGTPTLFVNDQTIAGAYPYEHFVKVIEGILNPGSAPAGPLAPGGAAPTAAGPPPPSKVVSFDDLKGRPALGPKDAPITLVEFSDFHCPFCKKVTPTLEQLMKNYPGKVKRVWRQYPLPFHTGADRSAMASECANEQDKFWEYHDKLFETQGGSRDDAALISLAEQAGLNKKKFSKCLTSGKYKDLIQKEIEAGNKAGVRGTPAVFVNGKLVSGAQPYENFDRLVKTELSKS